MGATGITAVFLQARLDSRRLPRKALLPLGDSTVIEQAMAALKEIPADIHLLLTEEDSEKELAPLAEAEGFKIFCGSKDNVLQRFTSAIKKYNAEIIVRATGDNPLVSSELAIQNIEILKNNKSDYCGFLGMPMGCGVEVLTASSLLRAEKETVEPYNLEHVSPYLYRNPGLFKIDRLRVDERYFMPEERVTIDLEEDYNFVVQIYKDLYHSKPISIGELVGWLKTHNRNTSLYRQ